MVFRTYPLELSAKLNALMPHLVCVLGVYYFAAKLPRKATTHGLMYSNVAAWMVISLKLGDQGLQYDPHLIDLPNWLVRCTMAHMQHPKDLFKVIVRENTPKEGDSARPRGFPVVLKLNDRMIPMFRMMAKKP